MPLGQAYAVSPDAEFLPYDEDTYRSAQERVLKVCAAHVPAIEPLCLHEIFLDLAGAGRPSEVTATIADSVRGQAGFTCQVGAGAGKLVARIAALQQPGAVVPIGQEARFLAPLPLSRLWLLDDDDIEHLQALGITTIGLLQGLPRAHLAQQFGRDARRVSRLARGIDDSPVKPVYPPSAVEARLALPEGIADAETVDRCLRKLCAEIATRLRERKEACSRLSMQVEPEGGRQVSRTLKLRSPAAVERELLLAARRLWGRMEPAAPVTAIAMQVSDFSRCSAVQHDLFSDPAPRAHSRRRAAEALASVQEHFGSRAVVLGAQVEVPRRERMLAALAVETVGRASSPGRCGEPWTAGTAVLPIVTNEQTP
jgi:DNA polymerase-4